MCICEVGIFPFTHSVFHAFLISWFYRKENGALWIIYLEPSD